MPRAPRRTRWLLFAFGGLVLDGLVHMGCTHGHEAADEAITQAVLHNLIHEERVNLTRVDVQIDGTTVYLSGEVQNHEQKERAEQIARTVPGVERVVNKLELQP